MGILPYKALRSKKKEQNFFVGRVGAATFRNKLVPVPTSKAEQGHTSSSTRDYGQTKA